MRTRILLTGILAAMFVIFGGCGNVANCPTCGTSSGGQYAVIDVIPVPEHNNTGTPGGPFNSFDISWVALNPSGAGDNMDYVSDRIGIAVQVIDTTTNLAVNSITGQNGVSGAGDVPSVCVPTIPPIIAVNGNFTRFGCRTAPPGTTEPFGLASGFGPSGNFGGFTGAQCCAARSQGVNPMSGPNGVVVTNDGKTLFVGNGSSSVVVFDLTTNPPAVIADIPTGVSADYDGPEGIAPCLVSWQGEAGSSAFCGDDRGDEISLDTKDQILAIINGDPGLPFITFIDVSGVIARTSNCLPVDPVTPYGPAISGTGSGTSTTTSTTGGFNPPTCILGQIYYDGVPPASNASSILVDNVNGPCPDPSNPTALSGVSGIGTTPIAGTPGSGTAYTIPCHHGPVLDNNTGSYALCNPTPQPGSNCIPAISPAGLGAHVWDPTTGNFLLTNANSTLALFVGNVDVINPMSPVGPIVVNSFPTLNCMPTSMTQGPGDNFLVGCADHDGESFPANEYIITNTTSANTACAMPPAVSVNCVVVTETGGVDETWYNPGDNKYYLAARDMEPGPVMGVIDAGTNLWLYNLPVNTNAHSIAVDPINNHVFMPQQAGAICGTQAGAGCIDVIAEQ
jgi:hypothetical protein